ncbi:MAG: hypothetical protein FWC47_09105 [Oscillospiraceae bacterium]|nr:hypothetical protein [Oscillospiraceae bacterium]
MAIKKHQRLNIKEITLNSGNGDFYLLFNQFLNDFYHADGKTKQFLIEEEPLTSSLQPKERCLLAATARQLAVDFNLSIPTWIDKPIYFTTSPIYAFNSKDKKFQEYLIETSLTEFKRHGLYLGGNILERV